MKYEELLDEAFVEGTGLFVDGRYNEAYPLLLKSAKAGNASAQFQLSNYYLLGLGSIVKDVDEGLKWIRLSVDNGNDAAAYGLACLYDDGVDIPRDAAEAVKWYNVAIARGYERACNNLGNRYADGDGVKKDVKKAFELYARGAKTGDEVAMCNLARCYEDGNGTSVNIKEAIKWFTKAIDNGDVSAMTSLGDIYLSENMGVTDHFKAIKYYKMAYDKGDDMGACQYGYCLMMGYGTPTDTARGKALLTKLGEKGVARGWYMIALAMEKADPCHYLNGEIFEYFKKAASLNYLPAMQDIVTYYLVRNEPTVAVRALDDLIANGLDDEHWAAEYLKSLESSLGKDVVAGLRKRKRY